MKKKYTADELAAELRGRGYDEIVKCKPGLIFIDNSNLRAIGFVKGKRWFRYAFTSPVDMAEYIEICKKNVNRAVPR